MGSAKRRTRLRNQKKDDSDTMHQFIISIDIILDKLLQQGGRCFYSGVPLNFREPWSDWFWSLERLDNDKGYTIENCVLVALGFNTAAQWTRMKILDVWRTAWIPDSRSSCLDPSAPWHKGLAIF